MPLAVALQDVGTQLMGGGIIDAVERAAQRVAGSVVLTPIGTAAAGRDLLGNLALKRRLVDVIALDTV